MNEVVLAAGGVVIRDGPDGTRHVALVHRPRYDDWSFPKGKLIDGETLESAAVREVLEETGLRCRLEQDLGAIEYRDLEDRPKIVRYWVMIPEGGTFIPGDEVDELEWLSPEGAAARLTYEHDRGLLRTLERAISDASLLLVRHGRAGSRSHSKDDDELRPLSKRGRRQAEGLVGGLRDIEIARIVSSPYVRCVQTVRPLAIDRGLQVEVSEALIEGAATVDALSLVDGLADLPALLCSHGDVIAAVMAHFTELGMPIEGEADWSKGSTWVLERKGGRFTSARSRPPAVP